MKYLDLCNEFRELNAQLKYEVELASAMGLYDTHKISENLMCRLLSLLCGYGNLKNLNRERNNYPGIDLADDSARVAFQITATSDLAKIKHTIETFCNHNLDKHYDRLIIYVLSQKQNSYSQESINTALDHEFKFDVAKDIWDSRELAKFASDAEPATLNEAVKHFKSYLRGIEVGLADEDIDPPLEPSEKISSNLIEVYFPSNLYVAQLNQEIKSKVKGKRKDVRKALFAFASEQGVRIPSSYVVHGDTLLSFIDLANFKNSPFKLFIEQGTVESIPAKDVWGVSEDQEYAFRGLLRFTLQQRLFQERVTFIKDDKKFVFLPREDKYNERVETWRGEKEARRTVFLRQYNKKDPEKVLMQKHLAFSVDFHQFDNAWFVAITPDWYFSFGEGYRRSGYAFKNLKWIKGQENNRQVYNHFRFIHAWLKLIDDVDLFSTVDNPAQKSYLTYGDIVSLDKAPNLDESKWEALPESIDDYATPPTQGLFGK